jgi:chromosome segregation ATPase
MSTKTRDVPGRKTKEGFDGILVRATPVKRLELDLFDVKAARASVSKAIQFETEAIADLEKSIAKRRDHLTELDHEITEIEAAIKLLKNVEP